MPMPNVNYDYFVHYVKNLGLPAGERVLDYGCGKGDILTALRESGIDAYGVDIYHNGISEEMLSNPLLQAGYTGNPL